MRDLVVLILHLMATVARLAGPGGTREVVAESVLVKQQKVQRRPLDEKAPDTAAPNSEPGSARDRPLYPKKDCPSKVRDRCGCQVTRLTSVLAKSSPLKRSGSPDVRASA